MCQCPDEIETLNMPFPFPALCICAKSFPSLKCQCFALLCAMFEWSSFVLQILSVWHSWTKKDVFLLLYKLGHVRRWRLLSSAFIALKIKSWVGAGSQLNFVCPTHRFFMPPCLSLLSVQIGKNLGKDWSLMGRCFHLIFFLFLSCLSLKY